MESDTTGLAEGGGARTGTVTFLFTDIEGSTTLLQDLGDATYREVLADHDLMLRSAVEAEGGEVFGSAGDAVFGVFDSAVDAVRAAVAAQRALAGHDWPDGVTVRVRMAVHTGEAVRTDDGNYTGLDLHRVARILSAGWGGQVLVSRATGDLIAGEPGLDLIDLGEHRLKDLTEREYLFQLVAPGLEEEFPALRSLDATPNNLPMQLTSFIGREQELATAAQLLEDTRLLTLTGPGGTGKTRLSLRLAFEVADRFPDGVFFVDLSAIFEPELVASEILTALGLPESGKRPVVERLVAHLGERRVLLVLDNFEQILDATHVVSDLLRGTPNLRIVVTSRASLRVYGEQEFPVPPLHVPDPDRSPPLEELGTAEAVALFVERASAVHPGFRLDGSNAGAVAQIVRRLDGLPLAIELAAARTKLLTPQAIAERLDDRLKLLAGGSRDRSSRRQTLRGAIEWSWDLLDDPQRCLLARLSVFVGGATYATIEAVCAEDLDVDLFDGLAALVDHSLVQQHDVDGEPRFDMLETIREFGLEQLQERGEGPEIRHRHLTHFLDLAEQAEPHFTGPDQVQWLDRIEREHDNIRTALSWAIDVGENEAALRFVATLWRFWQMRGHLQEARRRAERVLAISHPDADPLLLGRAHEAAGGIVYWMGDIDATTEHYQRSLELYRQTGDDRRIAYALYNLSFPYSYSSGGKPDFERALHLVSQALELFERVGDRHGQARALFEKGATLYFVQDLDGARRNFLPALEVFQELEQPFDIGWTLRMLGLVELSKHRFDDAFAMLDEALQLFVDAWDVSAIVLLLDDFRYLAQQAGDQDRAVILFGAMERWRQETGANLVDTEKEYDRRTDPAPEMDPERRQELLQRGSAMSLEDAIAYAQRSQITGPTDEMAGP